MVSTRFLVAFWNSKLSWHIAKNIMLGILPRLYILFEIIYRNVHFFMLCGIVENTPEREMCF